MDFTDSTSSSADLAPARTDELPALYRTILDLVVELERCDGGADARRIRVEALAAYSGAWDGSHHRRLRQLEARLMRSIAQRRSRSHRWPRRS